MPPSINRFLTLIVSALLLPSVSFAVPEASRLVPRPESTKTPIKSLIVVVGENVTFDTLYGTYLPRKGQKVNNLLSQRIVAIDGTPGPRYKKAVQSKATNPSGLYDLDPNRTGVLDKRPQPTLIGAYDPKTLQLYGPIPDPRFQNLTTNGPFPITHYSSYSSGIGDPAHRFFQMWQQTGGTNQQLDLYSWVATTIGTGSATPGVKLGATGQGGELMGFFNMSAGDAPIFKQLADTWAISDNYHQSIMGGTGANFFALATGDVAVYNQNNQLAVPPTNQIENPNPSVGTDNFYTNDGYAGGSYVNCSDASQPGVAPILSVLEKKHRQSRCENGAYYLVNNYDSPYSFDGKPQPLGADKYVLPPQVVPTIGELLSKNGVSWRWYTGGRDDADITGDPLYQTTVYPQVFAALKKLYPPGTPDSVIAPVATAQAIKTARPYLYNSIGDPMNASALVNADPNIKTNLKGLSSFMADVASGSLPEVSFVVPKNMDSGHPGYSAPALYEAFLKDLIAKVQASKNWSDTAIVITTDEGGGYFDTGAIQNIDFFGDGTRIPLIVVSPYAKQGVVDHTYQDHASILKFIEHNWNLPALSERSRDTLPNPRGKAYIPANGPAIGDLTSLFDFKGKPRPVR